MNKLIAVAAFAGVANAYVSPACMPHAAAMRAPVTSMDETIIQNALAGDLEAEGAENVFLTEVGWASYLDKEAKSSYNMNQRVSQADDGYFTPTFFSNPLEVLGSFKDGLLFSIGNPLASAFPTISNDPSGNRAYPPGANEINARTIKPKVKDFDKSKRVTGIPGFNAFGAPSSKSGNPLADFFGGN